MAASHQILKSTPSPSPIFKSLLSQTLRFSSSTPSRHREHKHEFSKRCEFLGSWEPPKDPKEAEAKLGMLRRDYAKQVKELRKEYIFEMELQRQEKQRKDEAKREAMRVAKEERKKAKAEMAKARAAERKVFEEEFRQTLMNERAEKLENWRMKEKMREEIWGEKKEQLRRRSSMWVDEPELEKKILEAIVDSTDYFPVVRRNLS